jgi:polyisoprenoid-binding protein YceI
MDTRELWRIDPESSTLRFSLRHKVLGRLAGQFDCWGGRILFDRADPKRSVVRIWVDLSSIDTGSEARDEQILNTPLFDVRSEPALVFDSELVDIDDAWHAAVAGSLTLQCIRKRIVVEIEASIPGGAGGGAHSFVVTGHASISRAAFGLRQVRGLGELLSDALLGDQIEIVAKIEAARDHAAAVSLPITPRDFQEMARRTGGTPPSLET